MLAETDGQLSSTPEIKEHFGVLERRLPRLQQWQGMYTTAMERLERNDREDQYGNAPLQQRSDVTVASPFNDYSRVSFNNNS